MKRRNFLLNFLLWTLSVFFGYKLGRKEGMLILGDDDESVSGKINFLNDELTDKVEILFENIVVKIPGDFSTLQKAIDKLSELKSKQGITITLLIESGYRPSKGIQVKDGDYSNIRIESMDAEVVVADDFIGNMMSAYNAKMPILACLFNQNRKGSSGYWLENNSSGYIEVGCGIKNVGTKGEIEHRGLYVGRGSTLSGDGAIFTNAGGRGAWITRGATASLENSNFDNAGDVGVYVSRNSSVHMPYSSIQNSGSHAVWVHRTSRLNAQDGLNLSGATGNALLVARASNVAINGGAIAKKIGLKGIEAIDSVVDCKSITLSGKSGNAQNGVESNGGNIHADGAVIKGFGGHGILAQRTGIVSAEGIKVSNSGGNGVMVLKAGKVFVGNGVVIDSGDKDLVLAAGGGGEINAHQCKTTSSTGSKPVIDNTNVTSFNRIENNQGIIWS